MIAFLEQLRPHHDELRKRLLISALVVAVCTGLAWLFIEQLAAFARELRELAPPLSRIDRFSKVLMGYGFTTIVRKTRGDDIDAACGQLAGDVIDRTKRTMRKRMQGESISVKEL